MRRVTPWIINGSFALALTAGVVWISPSLLDVKGFSEMPEQAVESLSTVGLSVEEVLVSGRNHTAAADILDALGAVRGTPIFDIDIPKAKSRIHALPWVSKAEIIRHLPNSLHIKISEYAAIAVWQKDGRHILVATDGTPITEVDSTYMGLPVVVGSDAPSYVNRLFEELAGQPAITARLKAAVRYGNRRWDIHLDQIENGIIVKLPETDITTAWDGLAALDAKHQLLSRAISEVDLRVPGRLVVRLKDGYAPLPRTSDQFSAEQEVRSDRPSAATKELAKGV